MLDMATVPPKPILLTHHGRLRWTTRWWDSNGKRQAKRFGYENEMSAKAAQVAYAAWLKVWMEKPQTQCDSRCLVAGLCDAYREYARLKYQRNGEMTSSFCNINLALRDLEGAYGNQVADDVRAPEIASLRDNVFMYEWIDTNTIKRNADGSAVIQSARTVNYRLLITKQAYEFGRSKGLISAETLLDVMSVKRVSARDSIARPAVKVHPVADAIVNATVEKCSASLGDMIRVQRLAGMRPSEICDLRPCDVDTSAGDVWFYEPDKHKTAYAGKVRIIVLPPSAVAILRPYLNRPLQDRCFTPREHAEQRGLVKRMKSAGDKWNQTTYRRAIARVCKAAGIEEWNPNRLRHAWATDVRRRLGIRAVQEGLSHQSMNTTETYAQKSKERLAKMARKLG